MGSIYLLNIYLFIKVKGWDRKRIIGYVFGFPFENSKLIQKFWDSTKGKKKKLLFMIFLK